MRWFAVLVAGCASAPPAAVTAVGARDCDGGTLVRDPRGRFSFCTPYGAWVSTTHADDDPHGPYDRIVYEPRPGSRMTITVHDRDAVHDELPAGTRIEHEDDAPFHGRSSHHTRARVHGDHEARVERWWFAIAPHGTLAIVTHELDDGEAREAIARALGSFRFAP